MDSKFNLDGDRMKKTALMTTAILIMSGCAGMPDTPTGYQSKIIETEHLSFYTMEKEDMKKGNPIRFYIEGDGTPNPSAPVALKMAEQDSYPNIVYLTRPCQYSENDLCQNKALYKEARFHKEIVQEMEELSLYFIQKYKAPSVEFVGYDGGGTMALLLSSRIPITTQVITVAGLLNTSSQTDLHEDTVHINEQKDILARIPQVHYVGGKDTVATRRAAERFVARLKNPKSAKVKVLPNMTHTGWEKVSFSFFENN